MKTIAQFISEGEKEYTQIKEILTKEYIMVHEFFHCEDAAETMGYADNFAWLLIFNYFHHCWSWKTNGAWKWPKDELKRGIVQVRTDNSTVPQDFEKNPDLAVDEDDINLDNLETPKWCHQVGSDPENIQCTYNAGSSNSASITAAPSATKTPASSTSSTKLTPTPTATQKCRLHIWEESQTPTDLDQTMYAKFTVYDGADKQVYNNDDWQKLQWGGSININQDDTGLAHALTVTFKKKDAYENTDANYQKRIFDVNYGTTSWRSDQAGSYDDMNSFPFCGVGEWDQAGGELTSEVQDGPQLLPSDCYFKC
ncbi:hypothetical protein NUU61_009916 [Penicillium alfredii]|uniref:Uncharacterized protein n=1 Tax=Penicillium alfredii TaxID=1506179 RepID=A0A9W9EH66_9EURO|nr:uncharacterized protein NUU61_009916 [Penicillium alfredii]KAJ5081652.1 hypothetical protein NUU61_009916 [Penicillium alfredii]